MDFQLKKRFEAGERVRVSAHAGWRKDVEGEIEGFPDPVVTNQGEDFFYLVRFDEPEHDLSEDGPYEMAQILSRYITKLD